MVDYYAVPMEVNVEKLIAAMRERPQLWNTSMKVSKRRKREEWANICSEMVEDYANLSSDLQADILKELLKKWKNVRDCYTRDLRRNRRSLEPGRTSPYAKYRYFDELSFLQGFWVYKGKDEEKSSSPFDDYDEVIKQETSDIVNAPATSKVPKYRKISPRVETPLSVQEFEFFDGSAWGEPQDKAMTPTVPTSTLAADDDDEDKLFLLSLVKDMKGIPLDSKLQAKCDIMKVIMNYKSKKSK